jgi:hypothetical protein
MTIQQESISIYNPNMPDELKEEALRKNSESLGRVANNRAVNILADVSSTAQVGPYSSSTYANISPVFSVGFASSGGIVEVNCNMVAFNGVGCNQNISIYIDSVLKAEVVFYTMGGNIRWIGSLAAGNHKAEIKWATGANIYLNYAAFRATKSTMQIVEYII